MNASDKKVRAGVASSIAVVSTTVWCRSTEQLISQDSYARDTEGGEHTENQRDRWAKRFYRGHRDSYRHASLDVVKHFDHDHSAVPLIEWTSIAVTRSKRKGEGIGNKSKGVLTVIATIFRFIVHSCHDGLVRM